MKKLQYNSPVILTFFFASLFVLALDAITGGASTLAAFCVYRSPVSPLFLCGCSVMCWATAESSIFSAI